MKFISFILSIFLIISTHASELPEKDFSSPRSSMNYFLKVMKTYKLGKKDNAKLTADVFDLSHLNEDLRELKAKEYAVKLINVLDKIEYIDIKKIPLKPKHDIWYFKKQNLLIDDEYVEVEIALFKSDQNNWLFTKDTLFSLNTYELYLKDKEIVKNVVADSSFRQKIISYMPTFLLKENLFLKNIQWLGLIFIFLVSFIVDRIFRHLIMKKTLSFFEHKHIKLQKIKEFFDNENYSRPFGLLANIIVFRLLLPVLEINAKALNIILIGTKVVMAIIVVLAITKVLDIICLFLLEKAKETENKFDDILIPLINKTMRFFIYAFAVIYIGDALNLNMKNILAGMGIGGIAFALAAKDTLSNLFGSFTVLMDRPFSIGDWVIINDKIEGTVEDVGLRSTRIRTFYDSIITVPNGNLTSAYVDNNGKRRYRRFSTKINVEYNTPAEKIENFCEAIRRLVLSYPHMRKDYFHVYFNGMSSSSLDILVYVFFIVPDWSEELKEKHNFLLDIKRIAEEMKINFAFPTQTLHLFNESSVEHEATQIDFASTQGVVEKIQKSRELMPTHRSDEGHI